MKKDGSGVGQRVYPVEYSSMTGNTVPHILNSFIPFDGGEFADICFWKDLLYEKKNKACRNKQSDDKRNDNNQLIA